MLYREELHCLFIALVQIHNKIWQEEEAQQPVDIYRSLQWTVLRKTIQKRLLKDKCHEFLQSRDQGRVQLLCSLFNLIVTHVVKL